MRLPMQMMQRLRPFLRRDLRARLTSAAVAVSVLFGLAWLGVSALGRIDSREAHQLRVDLGLEDAFAVCGDEYGGQPACSYDDRAQAKVDREFSHARMMRTSVLVELQARVDLASDRLEEANALVEAAKSSKTTGVLQGDNVALEVALLQSVVDLRPAPVASVEARRARLLWPLQVVEDCDTRDFDRGGWLGCTAASDAWRRGGAAPDMRTALLKQLELERVTLTEISDQIDRLLARDGITEREDDPRLVSRTELTASVLPVEQDVDGYVQRLELAAWLAVRPPAAALQGWDLFDTEADADLMSSSVHHAAAASGLRSVDDRLATAAVVHTDELRELVFQPGHVQWHGAWTDPELAAQPILKDTERYRSPLSGAQQWQIIGTVLFLLSSIMLVVVGPVVTATTTAREREAGTLPVLRMTGMSADDLALAMTIGPNVFALVAGVGLLALALPMLLLTVGPVALLVPVAALLGLSAATHLTAIGLGDALGQRVNAMVVGGLLALGILGPGLVGAVMVIGDMAATGFLLGPLPLALASGASLSGMPFAAEAITGGSSDLGGTIAGYALVIQGMLGLLCLLSWRRRVEQAWAPLFRPFEGALLALASVGCSALSVLDLSERVHVQTYDDVNLITFVAVGFLMPVLGWLLVTSLVRPARAASVASVTEARRGLLRFQLFVLLTAGALAMAYRLVLERTGLASEQSEVMWATLAHGLMIGQSVVATLLWTSRRRRGRHRSLMVGFSVVVLQLVAAVAIYQLEVDHVALTRAAANPFLLGMGASPYLTAFLVLLWAAGLGLILAAVLRERARDDAEEPSPSVGDDEEPGRRWLH